MKKFALIIFIILALGLVAWLAYWPVGPEVPDRLEVTPKIEQITFARHLVLGLLYEQAGDLTHAQVEYEAAAMAEQEEIATAAQNSLARILVRQKSPLLRLQSSVQDFLYWIADSLLKLFVAVVIIWFLWKLSVRYIRRPGYVILPLNDFTEDEIGKGFHSLIYATLQEAQQIHQQTKEIFFGSGESLDLPPFSTIDVIADAFQDLDNVAVGQIELPVASLVLFVHRWLGIKRNILFGTLHRYGNQLQLNIEIRTTDNDKVVESWQFNKMVGLQVTLETLELAQEVAYRFLFYTSSDLEASRWQSFYQFMRGIQEVKYYTKGPANPQILDRSIQHLTQATRLDPGYTSAQYALGIMYIHSGHYRDAREQFRRVINQAKSYILESNYNLGVAFYHEFQDWAYQKAIEHFNIVVGALETIERNSNMNLLLVLTYCGLANAHSRLVKSSSSSAEESDAQQAWNLAQAYCQKAKSIDVTTDEVKAAIQHAQGVANLGLGKVDEAIVALRTAVEIRPDYPIAYTDLAKIYIDVNEDEAIYWLKQALHWHPNYQYAHFQLGKLYSKHGDIELAEAAYRQASHIPDAQNSLGELFAAEGEYSNALTAFREAVRLNSQHARAWGNLAWWTVESGEHSPEALQRATIWARRAFELNRGTSYEWLSLDLLGWILLHRGLNGKAKQELTKSVQMRDDKIQNRYHLSYLYYNQGNVSKAMQILSKALSLSETGYWREKAEKLKKTLEES